MTLGRVFPQLSDNQSFVLGRDPAVDFGVDDRVVHFLSHFKEFVVDND